MNKNLLTVALGVTLSMSSAFASNELALVSFEEPTISRALVTCETPKNLALTTEDLRKAGYAKQFWEAMPDLGVTDKVYSVAQNSAEKKLSGLTDEVSQRVKSFLEWKIYGLADRHTIGLDGKKNGYVVENNSHLFRSIIKKVTGLDAESLFDVGFGSKSASKFLLNKLENYVANMILNGVQEKVATTSTNAIISALGAGLHLTEDRIEKFLSSGVDGEETLQDLVQGAGKVDVDVESLTSDIKESLKSVNVDADVSEYLSEREIEDAFTKDSRMQAIFAGLKSQISLYFLNVAEEATHDITEWAAQKIIDKSMSEVQVAATAAGGGIALAVSPSLCALYGLGATLDSNASDAQNKSYMTGLVDWAFGAENKQKQLQLATETKARSIIGNIYNTFFGDLKSDLNRVYGAYEVRELDGEGFEGWVSLEQTSFGFSLQEEIKGIGSDIVSNLTKRISDAASVATTVIKDTAVATATATKDVVMAVPNKIAADNEYMHEVAEKRGGGFMNLAGVFFDAMNGHLDDEESTEEKTESLQKSSWWNPLSW